MHRALLRLKALTSLFPFFVPISRSADVCEALAGANVFSSADLASDSKGPKRLALEITTTKRQSPMRAGTWRSSLRHGCPTSRKQIAVLAEFGAVCLSRLGYHANRPGGAQTPPSDPARKSMLSARLTVSVLFLVLCLIGPTGCYETPRAREQAIARGKALFELDCCGCHNGRRSDMVKIPPNLAGIFRRPLLPSGAPATDAMVRSTILTGRSGIMPSFEGSLTDQKIGDILRYLHTVNPQTPLCTTN